MRARRVRWVVVSSVTLAVAYLFMVGSLAWGDVVVGLAFGTLAALLSDRVGVGRTRDDEAERLPPLWSRVLWFLPLAWSTLRAVLVGTWRTGVWVLKPSAYSPATVRIPRLGRTDAGVAAWGITTSLSPDEFAVEVDTERDELLVHVLDGDDHDRVREHHRQRYERTERKVFP